MTSQWENGIVGTQNINKGEIVMNFEERVKRVVETAKSNNRFFGSPTTTSGISRGLKIKLPTGISKLRKCLLILEESEKMGLAKDSKEYNGLVEILSIAKK